MHRLAPAIIAATLLCGACPAVNAGTVTYDVNLNQFTEHGSPVPNVSVTGTITFDTTTQSITSSALTINELTSPLTVALPSLPTLDDPSHIKFIATPTTLSFESLVPVGDTSGAHVLWRDPVTTFTFYLTADQPEPGNEYIELNTFILSEASGGNATSPAPLLVGTAAATPEPTTLTLLGIGIAVMAGYGWRRRKPAAA